MTEKFNIANYELMKIIVQRAKVLSDDLDWDSPLETQYGIDRLQAAFDEYKSRIEEYQKEHSIIAPEGDSK